MSRTFQIDLGKVEAEHLRIGLARSRTGPRAWRIQQWAWQLLFWVLLLVGVLPLVTGDGLSAYDPRDWELWTRLAYAIGAVALNIAWTDRMARRIPDDPRSRLARLQQEADDMTGPGWPKRTLLLGAKLGLGVGVPIGLLLALLPLEAYTSSLDRLLAFGMFLGLTFAWTLPMGFVIRALSLWSLKDYRKAS